jgi:hypothetical protein
MASSFLLSQKSTSMFLQWERGVVVDFIGEMQHAVGRVRIWSGKSGSCEDLVYEMQHSFIIFFIKKNWVGSPGTCPGKPGGGIAADLHRVPKI